MRFYRTRSSLKAISPSDSINSLLDMWHVLLALSPKSVACTIVLFVELVELGPMLSIRALPPDSGPLRLLCNVFYLWPPSASLTVGNDIHLHNLLLIKKKIVCEPCECVILVIIYFSFCNDTLEEVTL